MSGSSDPKDPFLLRVEGAWWVRRGCVAAASCGFQTQQPPPPKPWWQVMLGRRAMQTWLFSLRHGEGLLAARGLRLIELSVSPQNRLAVQLDRVIAFEEGLEFATRYVRRIPLSGAGARHAVFFSGAGRVVVAAVGSLHEVRLGGAGEDSAMAPPDFDPEAVVAWPADLKLRFTLHRLTWSTFLSPRGFRETRVTFSGAGSLWLDAGCEPAPLAPMRGRQLPAGPFGAR
ncbi:MAG: AIM24 family protein [Candidatus Hydrogenedentes bacterium]|nr:AIM24 family protein [Candidatus Hydrogenedentota bacterium]